ncbi:MAG: acylphosphatase [Gammaproteobacteria bacterium]|nr:acylphosphatase [Gammaproteobacteria bacterium]
MNTEERLSRRCRVTGRVQGVWFRAATRDKALELGLDGEARNLPDGAVEVVVTGPAQQLEALCQWLWQGSPMSRVEAVECRTIATTTHRGFSTA